MPSYEVLVWDNYEFEDKLGVPQGEDTFYFLKDAKEYYDTIDEYLCKIIMRYNDDVDNTDLDGTVLKEDWKRIKYYACQDGDKFYVQDDPESEEWLASFNTEREAEQYIEFLGKI